MSRSLEQAGTSYQVLLAAREYLDALSPEQWARLPAPCRPWRILDEGDIARYSRCLSAEYLPLRGTAADVAVLEEMWSFFLQASIRIDRLQEKEAGKG